MMRGPKLLKKVVLKRRIHDKFSDISNKRDTRSL